MQELRLNSSGEKPPQDGEKENGHQKDARFRE
jgi:hypothetical protein